MQYFEKNAVLNVELRAKETEIEDKNIIEKIIKEEFYHYINADFLVSQILNCCDVTLNFHPDRFSNNGNMIIQNLINEGIYQSQFLTGTTNGGKTAYPNGDRDIWEKICLKKHITAECQLITADQSTGH